MHGLGEKFVLEGAQLRPAVGVRVARSGGVDYILSTTRDDVATVFSDPRTRGKFSLTGRLGVVRADLGRPAALILLQGQRLRAGQ